MEIRLQRCSVEHSMFPLTFFEMLCVDATRCRNPNSSSNLRDLGSTGEFHRVIQFLFAGLFYHCSSTQVAGLSAFIVFITIISWVAPYSYDWVAPDSYCGWLPSPIAWVAPFAFLVVEAHDLSWAGGSAVFRFQSNSILIIDVLCLY